MPETVDVALNVFGKPRQTALALLSLLKHSNERIQTIYLLIERGQSQYDTVDMAFLSRLSPKIKIIIPQLWLKLDALDVSRLHDKDYRYSIRYQYAWEHAEAGRLLLMHNDVHFKGDVVGLLLGALGEAFVAGQIGQCWNCPAARQHIVAELGINGRQPCVREHYEAFRPSFAELDAMYKLVRHYGEHFRNFLPRWSDEIRQHPWPLPECRANEVCCLVNLDVARKATMPFGRARPFGTYVSAGSHNMDIAVAWFRDMHLQGFRARHFDTTPYVEHTIGHSRLFDEAEYRQAEDRAEAVLRAEFSDFVAFSKRFAPGLFPK